MHKLALQMSLGIISRVIKLQLAKKSQKELKETSESKLT